MAELTSENYPELTIDELNYLKMQGGGVKDMAQGFRNIANMIKSGNFKLGAIIEAFAALGLWPLVNWAFKTYVHMEINNRAWMFGICKPINTVLQAMNRYRLKYRKPWQKLVKVASNTRDYNNNAMKVLIFVVTQCPEIVDEILRAFIDFKKLYHMIYDKMPLPTRIAYKVVEVAIKKYLLKGKTLDQRLDEASEWVRKRCNVCSKIIDLVFPDRDLAQQTLELILNLAASTISKAVNSVDPYGIIMPISTFVFYDIIVARVDKGQTRIPLPLYIKIPLTIVVIIIISVIISKIKSLTKEGYTVTELVDETKNKVKNKVNQLF